MHLMVLLGNEAQVEARFVIILTQDRCTFCANRPQARKSVWTHPMEVLVYVGHVESHFCPFGDSISVGAR
jgi:hypothetical protein